MSFNLANIPMSVPLVASPADPGGDVEYNAFRFPGEGRVLAVYAVNDAAIATATNTLAVIVGHKGTSGTDALTTIAAFVATSTWAADTPRTGTLTAANQDIPSGTWIAVKYDETGTGTWTRMTVQMDYMQATGPTT